MNIIEKTKDILLKFPKISMVCNDINIDFADTRPTSYGLSSVGDELIYEDILGNQTRLHNFMFYASYSGINDFERSENSAALTELSVWLTKQVGEAVSTEISGELLSGEITEIKSGGGRLYAIEDNQTVTGMRYQLQISVKYTVNF